MQWESRTVERCSLLFAFCRRFGCLKNSTRVEVNVEFTNQVNVRVTLSMEETLYGDERAFSWHVN